MFHTKINHTDVFIAPIVRHEGMTRRQAEVAARDALITHALGADIKLGHSAHGAPVVEGRSEHISISHSQEFIAIAINPDVPVGIDIEAQRSQLHTVIPKFLNDKEQTVYTSPELLLRAWTLKEALYKAALDTRLGFVEHLHIPLDLNADETKITTPEGAVIPYRCNYFVFRQQQPVIGVALVEAIIP